MIKELEEAGANFLNLFNYKYTEDDQNLISVSARAEKQYKEGAQVLNYSGCCC